MFVKEELTFFEKVTILIKEIIKNNYISTEVNISEGNDSIYIHALKLDTVFHFQLSRFGFDIIYDDGTKQRFVKFKDLNKLIEKDIVNRLQ